jgi:rhodanese-related sulfurtransferase
MISKIKNMRKQIVEIVVGFILLIGLLVLVMPSHQAQASSMISQEKMVANVDELVYANDMRQAIKEFLISQPDRYYAIKSVDDLKKLVIADKNYPLLQEVVLIDVRTPAEYAESHIPSAINLPVEVLADHLELIPENKTVVVYCSTGYRAAMAVEALHLLGFDNVQGFAPGFQAWRSAGEAIEIG